MIEEICTIEALAMGKTWVHQLDARIKIILAFSISPRRELARRPPSPIVEGDLKRGYSFSYLNPISTQEIWGYSYSQRGEVMK